MKAVRINEYGDVDALRYEGVERPIPGPGQVLIHVAASGFNPIDTWFRAGIIDQIYPVQFPYTFGIEVAGEVVELGPDVLVPTIGASVIGFLPMTEGGAAAEYVVAPAVALTAAPGNVSLEDAAAIPVGALTAWQALFDHGGLQAGQRVLINGAGGGVGGFAVQMAKHAGAHVIATASSRSEQTVRSKGADEVIDYTIASVAGFVKEPVDVVVNLVVGTREDTEALLGVTKSKGVLVSATSPGGEFHDRVRIVFFSVRSDREQLARIVEQVEDGDLQLDITERLPLSDAPLAHRESEAGLIRGRVILVPPK